MPTGVATRGNEINEAPVSSKGRAEIGCLQTMPKMGKVMDAVMEANQGYVDPAGGIG